MKTLIVVLVLVGYVSALCTTGPPGPAPEVISINENCAKIVGLTTNATICHPGVGSDFEVNSLKVYQTNAFSVAIFDGDDMLKSVNLTNGQVLIGSTGAAAVPALLTGTTDQITVTAGAGSLTLATPQSIAATSSPTFAGLTVSGGTGNATLILTKDKVLSSVALGNGKILIGRDSNTPVAAGLTGTANQIIVTGGEGSITLSTPQGIAITDSPTFNAATLTAATNQIVLGSTPGIILSAPAPATATRTVTFPDPGAAAQVLYNVAAQTISGVKTFSAGVVVSATSAQLVLSGPTRTLTLSAVSPASSSRTVTLQDPGTDCDVVYTASAQTIAGIKTFSDATDASSSTVGGTVVSGGLAVLKKIYVGDGVFLKTTGGTASSFDYYEQYSGTLSLGGAIAPGTSLAIKIVRIGALVTMDTAALSAATVPAGPISSITTALPSRFFPLATHYQSIVVTENSATKAGLAEIRADGFIHWYATVAGGNYTASTAACGFPVQTYKWTVL